MTSPARSTDPREAALDALFADLDRSDAPGALVAVRSGEDLLYRRGFGLASVQHGVANRPETRIRFASITKQFTCVALMLLAEDGLVDVDAPISAWLPGLASPLGAATLRQLMTHTSGHRCTLEMGSVANGFTPQLADWQARALRRQHDVQFSPGTGQLYCNGSYVALTEVIERCAGKPFAEVLAERIFAPLAMFDSAIVADDRTMVPGMAAPHVRAGTGWRRPPSDADMLGDGGLVSTVDDMLRWLAHLRGPKRIGSAESWRQLLAPATLANGFRSTYAMGFKRHRYRGTEVIQHSGGLFGLNAQVVTVPDRVTDVVIAINGAPASATRLAFAVLDICLGDSFAEPPSRRASAGDYDWLLGRHFTDRAGLLLAFGDAGGSFGLAQMHMAPAPVLYEDDDLVYALFEEIGFGPLVWAKADLLACGADPHAPLPVTIAGDRHILHPVQPSGAEPALLQTAAGDYRSEALAAMLSIAPGATAVRIKGDYSGVRDFAAVPLSDRHLGIVSADGEERYAIELDLAGGGPAPGLWIDTHRARRMRFDRVGVAA